MEITAMDKDDLDDGIALFVQAFQNSPFYRYIAPDADERLAFLTVNFRQRLEHSFGVNDMDAVRIHGNLAAAAVWIPPAELEPAHQARPDPALEEALSAFSRGVRERFFAFLAILTGAREQVIRQPYWSLAPIAVAGAYRGRGIASTLIRKKLALIDGGLGRTEGSGAGLPCFIGTQDAVNLSIYARYGFELVRQEPIADPEIINYTMIRQGRPQN
jgi:GNAT superfamily N-acetyltransferase